MVTLGFFSLGVFIGALTAYAAVNVTNWNDPVAIVSGLVALVISGGLYVFIEGLPGKGRDLTHEIYGYPIGLAVALMWIFIHFSGQGNQKTLYTICGIGVTFVVVLVLFVPAVRKLLP